MKVCCVINDKSGSAVPTHQQAIAELFAQQNVEVKFYKIADYESVKDLVNNAMREGFDIVVAGGGDGTVNAVASALMEHPSTRLGVLPLGTLNHFARDIGIPMDLTEAVNIICAGHSKAIDLGAVNDCYFLNNSSVGLYPAIVKLRESLQHVGYGKWWAALLSSLRMLRKFRRLDVEVQPSSGLFLRRKTPLLFVGNNAYETNAAQLGKRLAVDQGRLWINIPTSPTLMGFIIATGALLLGREKPANTIIFETTSLKVSTRKRLLTVAADGEVLHLKSPLNYRILPKALNVIVPAGQAKTQ